MEPYEYENEILCARRFALRTLFGRNNVDNLDDITNDDLIQMLQPPVLSTLQGTAKRAFQRPTIYFDVFYLN